jgi:hypothetical protein
MEIWRAQKLPSANQLDLRVCLDISWPPDSSGSNDPIGELEARVDRLRSELHHGCRERARDIHRIAELSAKVNRLQYEISKRDTAIDWVVN